MKYLLISPPKVGIKMFIESPPIGLGYLATTLRKLGHEVDIKDAIVEGWDVKQTAEYVKEYNPDIVGINLFSTALQSVKALIQEIKPLGKMIILGGPHCSGSPLHTLTYFPEVDYAFRGEAEIPITQFHEFLDGKRDIEEVAGLIYRVRLGVKSNPPVEHPDVEQFGMPAWDLIDPRKYFKQVNVGDKSINVHFSRGCPFQCRFCVKLGTKLRMRSHEHIWAELDYLNATYGVERFIINDEGTTMHTKFFKEFLQQAIEKGSKYTYFTATGMRLNRVDDELLRLMVKARCENSFGVGIESAVPRVRQELMNKSLPQDELLKGLNTFKRHGFEVVGNFIIGFPGETEAELKESVNWAVGMFDKGLLYGANFVPFLPLPGAEATRMLQETGELPKDYDFSQINLSRVVYAPKGMTIERLDKLRAWAVWKLNSRPRMMWRYLSDWGRFTRAVVTFLRIFAPNKLLPKDWRRR